MAGADRMTIEEVVKQVLVDEHADLVRAALEAVVVHRRGSANAGGIRTARVRRASVTVHAHGERLVRRVPRVFEACRRGSENGFGRLLDYYDVPCLLSSDDGALSLTSEAEVRRALQQQIDGDACGLTTTTATCSNPTWRS